MKQHQVRITLFVFMLLCLSSCGLDDQGKSEGDYNYIPKADEYQDEIYTNTSTIDIKNVGEFSSGRAWISYTCGGINDYYLGCIDKNGNLLFSFNRNDIGSHTEFINGLSWIFDRQGQPYIINDQGEIVMYPGETQFDGIASRSDEYLLAYKNKEGFDSDEYLFLIINSEGDIVKEISSRDCTQITWKDFQQVVTHDGLDNNIARYCGNGIFRFMKSAEYAKEHTSYSSSKCLYTFYDVSNDTFSEKECNLLAWPTEADEKLCVLSVDGEDVLFDITAQTDNLDQIKELKEMLNADYQNLSYSCGPISNGKAVYVFYGKDRSGNSFRKCAYADRAGIHLIECEYVSRIRGAYCKFDQTADRLLIPLDGKDGNFYLAIIDSAGNSIMEPLMCDERYSSDFFKDGRFKAGTEEDIVIYDTDGNEVFSLNDIGGSSISEFSDDVAVIDQNKNSAKAVDIYGNILFDNINTAGNQYITLSSS